MKKGMFIGLFAIVISSNSVLANSAEQVNNETVPITFQKKLKGLVHQLWDTLTAENNKEENDPLPIPDALI
ncbi:hypothetical protein ACQKDS_17135 [Serratia sp. NPDC078593]|uniref:hypothetical protein n=1 Tax=unclassified Serratia (in: enterobacteria) TaxID=2647522 RepID=UPI0037D897CD